MREENEVRPTAYNLMGIVQIWERSRGHYSIEYPARYEAHRERTVVQPEVVDFLVQFLPRLGYEVVVELLSGRIKNYKP